MYELLNSSKPCKIISGLVARTWRNEGDGFILILLLISVDFLQHKKSGIFGDPATENKGIYKTSFLGSCLSSYMGEDPGNEIDHAHE